MARVQFAAYVRFSNRPVRVKHLSGYPPTPVSMSLTGSRFGLGTKALVWGFLSQAG